MTVDARKDGTNVAVEPECVAEAAMVAGKVVSKVS
jgi:hypothetical protein